MTGAAAAARAPSRTWLWLAAAALAVLAVIAADALRTPAPAVSKAEAPIDPAELRPAYGPATFAEARLHADRDVAGMRQLADANPDEWLRLEALARALAARFRLTADPRDLAEADRLLDRALGLASWPAGPALSRAEVSLAMHDLAGAERALTRFDAAAAATPDEQAEAGSLRCEIAIERGQVAEARRLCAGDGLAVTMRRASLAAQTGDAAEAARIVEAALRDTHLSPASLATVMLQRASIALTAGDWDTSRRWARAAERVFPGHWLGEAYLAQQAALDGDRAQARRRYEALAEATGNPDVMGALARLAESDGKVDEAGPWAKRAGDAWEQRSRLLPLAYATHHAEHLILQGDRRRGLALAAADYRRRPYGPVIAHYAFALWRSGDAAAALDVVRKGQASGFMTADLKFLEAVSLSSLGRSAEAGEALAAARRLNPRIDSAAQQYMVFGRD